MLFLNLLDLLRLHSFVILKDFPAIRKMCVTRWSESLCQPLFQSLMALKEQLFSQKMSNHKKPVLTLWMFLSHFALHRAAEKLKILPREKCVCLFASRSRYLSVLQFFCFQICLKMLWQLKMKTSIVSVKWLVSIVYSHCGRRIQNRNLSTKCLYYFYHTDKKPRFSVIVLDFIFSTVCSNDSVTKDEDLLEPNHYIDFIFNQ